DRESILYADGVRKLRQREYDNADLYSDTETAQAEQKERSQQNIMLTPGYTLYKTYSSEEQKRKAMESYANVENRYLDPSTKTDEDSQDPEDEYFAVTGVTLNDAPVAQGSGALDTIVLSKLFWEFILSFLSLHYPKEGSFRFVEPKSILCGGFIPRFLLRKNPKRRLAFSPLPDV
ncbi:hypothetical protein EZS27_043943, partial [termite gut metagenome]